jgi:hypothetical protein
VKMAKLSGNFDKLKASVEWSTRQVEKARKSRVEHIRQYVGMHYGENGADQRVPVNFMELAVTIYTRQLAARAPRCMITAHNEDLRPYAKNMELALNQIPDEVDLGSTLRRAVMEAMFAYAVVKVGLQPTGIPVLGIDPGAPFVDLISIDDHFMDMTAKCRKEMQFEGNDYWLDIDAARELYDGDNTKVDPDEYTLSGAMGEPRAEGVGTQDDTREASFKDRVRLRDVWLPGERKLVTYGITSGLRYREIEWDGPDMGPYHMLGFSDVPGNLLPLPPAALWIDMHELANRLFRKLGKQADGKKTVHAFNGDDEAVNAFKNAGDGDGIRFSGAAPQMLTTAGVDPTTLAFFLQVKDLHSYFAGNLDALGGLGPMSDTVGQDKMMSEAASARVKTMAEATVDFAKGIFRSLAWYEWVHPAKERVIEKEVKGAGIKIASKWSKATRKGEFLDFNFDIDAYSMQDDSPSIKMQKIATALERFIYPAMPFIQEQGGFIDMQELTGMIAKYSNTPELTSIVRFAERNEREVQGNPSPERTAKPANTHRTYERINRPGATRHGKDDTMSRILMGAGVQDAESAALVRGVA